MRKELAPRSWGCRARDDPASADTGGGPIDAIALLKADHGKAETLLTEPEATTERGVKTREDLFATVKGELTLHEVIEEELFYAELKAHPKALCIILEDLAERMEEPKRSGGGAGHPR